MTGVGTFKWLVGFQAKTNTFANESVDMSSQNKGNTGEKHLPTSLAIHVVSQALLLCQEEEQPDELHLSTCMKLLGLLHTQSAITTEFLLCLFTPEGKSSNTGIPHTTTPTYYV